MPELDRTPTVGSESPGHKGGHRAFAAYWEWATKHESQTERELRREAATRLHGRVLELGVGVGANWNYLPPGIEYVGIEPDTYMLNRARKRSAALGRQMDLHEERAERLSFEDDSFDAVLVTFTLCSVEQLAPALSEAYRVLKPGGELVFVEHVRPEGAKLGWLCDRITPAWRRIGGGCHPNRRTTEAIARSGLDVETLVRRKVNGIPMVAGVARKLSVGPSTS